jgi:hypothetical protein
MRPYLPFLILVPTLCFADEPQIQFSRDIAPILLKNCQECHGPGKAKGKFRIDTFARLARAGDSGHASITPGHPETSELYRLLTTPDADDRMPKKADRLPEAQIQLIKRWIDQGARFDGPNPTAPLASILPRGSEPAPPEVYSRPVPVTALAFTPDGQTLAASGYHEITLWSPLTGKLLGRIKNLPERTWSIAISPDGKFLAAASGDPGASGELRVYALADPSEPRILERIGDMMLVVRFSPDGAMLAGGGADNTIGIYDVPTFQRRQLIEQHADWITDLAFSPDGKHLASASRDKSARVFDTATGSMEGAYLGHTEAVLAIAWTPDGRQVFTAGQDRSIHLWDPAKPDKTIAKIPIEGDIYKLDASTGVLLACSSDHTLRSYSPRTRTLARTIPTADWPYALSISQTTHDLAVGNYNGQVQIFPAASATPAVTFTAAPGQPR